MGLHSLLRSVCPKKLRIIRVSTETIKRSDTVMKNSAIILKFEQCGLTIQHSIQKPILILQPHKKWEVAFSREGALIRINTED